MTHKRKPSEQAVRDEQKSRIPRVSSSDSKQQLSQFERILSSIYPVFSALLDLGTVYEIAALKQTSGTLRDLIQSAQIRDITFVRNDDPFSRFWIGVWGLQRAKEIFTQEDADEERMYEALEEYERTENITNDLLVDCLKSIYPGLEVQMRPDEELNNEIQFIGPISNLRSLRLDGTSVNSKFIDVVIFSESFPNLASFMAPGWYFESCEYKGKPNMKNVNL